ncbi:N-acetyltransferase [Sphingomonas piscis]|uniref:N-acetyltransferase n=1 Tax=Sphingomonas piscis TaxID=2714943 RepID=A0A6G7YTJ3_9SPHN|nr:N-acetyltransferase [Sphingomonas piscis]
MIRLARAEDSSAIAAIYRPYVADTRITFEEVPPAADEIVQRMSNPCHPWLVLEKDGIISGYTSTATMRARAAYRWSVETGIYLAESAKGQGLGKALLSAHLTLLENQGFTSAFAGIALPNDASIGLHEALGFRLMGVERGVGFKLSGWSDVARYQRDLAPRTNPPGELKACRDCFEALPVG